MNRIYFSFPGNESLTSKLASREAGELGIMDIHRFPDGESYVRIRSNVCTKHVVVVCTLHRPDEKIMFIYFFSQIAKAMNAATITLVCPYLPYMRQDKLFHPGEGVSSVDFAKLISSMVDKVVTIDPHLHRFHALNELYPIPTLVKSATESIASWIKAHVKNPFIIGPDRESEQWVKRVAQIHNTPYLFLSKNRLGDKRVELTIPDLPDLSGKTPVVVDDIISSGKTMIETIRHLKKKCSTPPVCIGIHGIFAGNAYEELKSAGAADVITTNTIPHRSNRIDITSLLILS